MVHSFFDPKKKEAMMDRVKKGLPPPQFGDPFAKEKDKSEAAAPQEKAEDLVEQAKQVVIKKAIADAKAAISDAEQKSEMKWSTRGRLMPGLISVGLAVAAGVPLLKLFGLELASPSSLSVYYLASGFIVGTVGLGIYAIANKLSKERISDYFESKCSNYATRKYYAIKKVLHILEHNQPQFVSDKELMGIAGDPEQRKHLKAIASAGSKEAQMFADRIREEEFKEATLGR